MKRILSMILVAALMLSVLAFVGCNKKEETLKLGLGVYTTAQVTNASEDQNGSATENSVVAAVLVDSEGKIVKCVIDSTDGTVAYTADGKALANDSFTTKNEQRTADGMGRATQEWYAQAEDFCALAEGKTLSEVKNSVDGSNEKIAFVSALEKAVNGALDSNATAKDSLKIGVSTAQNTKDAKGEANGYNQLETTFFAAAVNGEGKIVAAKAECVQVDFTFDINGVSKFDTARAILGKYEQGNDYDMLEGGAIKEWYAQADAFCAACIGKTVSEVTSLMGEDNHGTADIKAAGCTILVDGFVKAASKIK